jgi:hypothetical protein
MTDADTGTTPAQCANCGRAFRGGERFCEWCGAPNTADAAAQPASGGPPPSPYGSAPPPPPPPGYGAPLYAHPGGMPQGYPAYAPAVQTTNGFSIASLVLGIVWVFGIGAILAVIFGFVARKQIRESGGRQGGNGMAIAGIVLGFVGIVGLILWIVLIVSITNNLNCLNQQNSITCTNNTFNFNSGNTGSLNSGTTGSTGTGTGTSSTSGLTGSTLNSGSTGVVTGPSFAFF